MFGDGRGRSKRDGIRAKTLEMPMYRTRIGLQTMVANDRRGSGAPVHFRGNFRGNFRCSIGVTPVVVLLMQKISAETLCKPITFAFPGFNSIPQFALPN